MYNPNKQPGRTPNRRDLLRAAAWSLGAAVVGTTAATGANIYRQDTAERALDPREYFPQFDFDQIKDTLQDRQEPTFSFTAEEIPALISDVMEYRLRQEINKPGIAGAFVETEHSQTAVTTGDRDLLSFHVSAHVNDSKLTEGAVSTINDVYFANFGTGKDYTTTIEMRAANAVAHHTGRYKRVLPRVFIDATVTPSSLEASDLSQPGGVNVASSLRLSATDLNDSIARIAREAISGDSESFPYSIGTEQEIVRAFLEFEDKKLHITFTTDDIMAEKAATERQQYKDAITPEVADRLSEDISNLTRWVAPRARKELELDELLSAENLEAKYQRGEVVSTSMPLPEGAETIVELSPDSQPDVTNLWVSVEKDTNGEQTSGQLEFFIGTDGQIAVQDIHSRDQQTNTPVHPTLFSEQECVRISRELTGGWSEYAGEAFQNAHAIATIKADGWLLRYTVSQAGRVVVSARKEETRY